MICKKCGGEIPDGSVFCNLCGKRQEPEARKHRKRVNGSGSISKLSGNRKKPWVARRAGVTIGTFETRAEAQKALERITDQAISEKYNMTFREVYQRWYTDHCRDLADSTANGYAAAFNQCRQLHEMKIRKILRSDYQGAIIKLEQEGKSKSTCQKLRLLLAQLGRWAMEEEITANNPAEGLTTAAKQKSVRAIFTEDNIKTLKAIAEGIGPNRWAARICLVLISCGCRPGELFTAPLSCCKPDYMIWGSKTEAGRDRVIPIGPDGLPYYQELRIESDAMGGDRLIDSYRGRHDAQHFSKLDFKNLMQELGRDDLVPYSCRHTFITRAIAGGMDLPKLEAIVGHVDRETTRIYTHLQAPELVEAVEKATNTKLTVCDTSVTKRSKAKVNAG